MPSDVCKDEDGSGDNGNDQGVVKCSQEEKSEFVGPLRCDDERNGDNRVMRDHVCKEHIHDGECVHECKEENAIGDGFEIGEGGSKEGFTLAFVCTWIASNAPTCMKKSVAFVATSVMAVARTYEGEVVLRLVP